MLFSFIVEREVIIIMNYAPIIIFAFNRLESLKACVSALQANVESKDSDLIVFVDGPRQNKNGEAKKVQTVRDFVKTIEGFKSLTYYFSETNKGLGPSIIAGVTDVINQYGKTIVIEDDLIVSRNMLAFMHQGLNSFEGNEKVFSVCGYSNKVKIPKDYKWDAYFCSRSSSWGWATWKDRWGSVDWNLNDWDSVQKNARAFNRWGGSDCYGMLKEWKEGLNKSWAIRFCYSQFIQGKLSLFPVISKVDNEGFDGEGANCKRWSRFKSLFDNTNNKTFNMPETVQIIDPIRKSALAYHSIGIRIYSRIMYFLHRY